MMLSRKSLLIAAPLALAAAAAGWWQWSKPKMPAPETVAQAYAQPLPPPEAPLRVFHLGHSLVGTTMPAMLAQLAGPGHAYESQLGAGTSMREHYEPDLEIFMFEEANSHPRYRDAREAVTSGEYDALVITEMVEIRDAIRWHDSPTYLHRWAELARATDPAMRIYLYETWHPRDDPEGWLERLDADLERYWEGQILFADLARAGPENPVRVIPAGQVMARFVREVEATPGGIGGIESRADLFGDQIHINDLGAYLVALTHYAVLYGQSPVGLPHALMREDGTPADAPGPEAARRMQEIVWEVVTSYPKTGVAQVSG